MVQTMVKQRYLAIVFLKDIQCDYGTFENVKPALQNRVAKTFNLELILSLISNAAPSL